MVCNLHTYIYGGLCSTDVKISISSTRASIIEVQFKSKQWMDINLLLTQN